MYLRTARQSPARAVFSHPRHWPYGGVSAPHIVGSHSFVERWKEGRATGRAWHGVYLRGVLIVIPTCS